MALSPSLEEEMVTDVRVPAPSALLETGVMGYSAGTVGRAFLVDRRDLDSGIDCLDVTLTTPGALDAIQALRNEFPGLALGAGTVLTVSQVRDAAAAGAGFIVSPDIRPEVIRAAHDSGVASSPGALTPTEVASAWEAGATAIKNFPGGTVGPGHISALHGPFPDIAMMPTGRVALATIGALDRVCPSSGVTGLVA